LSIVFGVLATDAGEENGNAGLRRGRLACVIFWNGMASSFRGANWFGHSTAERRKEISPRCNRGNCDFQMTKLRSSERKHSAAPAELDSSQNKIPQLTLWATGWRCSAVV
jgi:hypothetical protein